MNNDPLKGLRGEAETIATLELETQSLTRRLEEAENNKAILQAKVDDQAEIIKFGSEECDRLNARITEAEKERDEAVDYSCKLAGIDAERDSAIYERDTTASKLTALRTAAEGARDALDAVKPIAVGRMVADARGVVRPAWGLIQDRLAALRAVLGQAASNASNSPTASRDTQG